MSNEHYGGEPEPDNKDWWLDYEPTEEQLKEEELLQEIADTEAAQEDAGETEEKIKQVSEELEQLRAEKDTERDAFS